MIKVEPWLDESDPLLNYYGLLTLSELDHCLCLLDEWQKLISETKNNTGLCFKLLDFYNRYNEGEEFSIYKKLCQVVDPNDCLLWMPLGDEINDQDLIFQYDPPMIAKTKSDNTVLDAVSRSFMKLQNGGYVVMDSIGGFIGIVIDGYYMLTFIKTEFMNDNFLQYIDKWNCIDGNLDDVLKTDLFSRI